MQVARFIISLSVGLLVLVFIGTIALNQFFATSTASFDAQTLLLWAIVPVIFLLAVVLRMLSAATNET